MRDYKNELKVKDVICLSGCGIKSKIREGLLLNRFGLP